jgi:hypothetical protein
VFVAYLHRAGIHATDHPMSYIVCPNSGSNGATLIVRCRYKGQPASPPPLSRVNQHLIQAAVARVDRQGRHPTLVCRSNFQSGGSSNFVLSYCQFIGVQHEDLTPADPYDFLRRAVSPPAGIARRGMTRRCRPSPPHRGSARTIECLRRRSDLGDQCACDFGVAAEITQPDEVAAPLEVDWRVPGPRV